MVLLVVDDELSHLESLRRLFEREGHTVHTAASGELALEVLRAETVDLILTDLMMPGMSGHDLLRAARTISPEVDVVVMTAYGTVEAAVTAMKEGAYDFIQKPLKSAIVLKTVERCLERQALKAENLMLKRHLAEASAEASSRRSIVGRAMVAMMETVQQAAPSTASVLLYGESGTGKELIARAIHEASPRKDGPMVAVNCAALPETILESELFGYEKGAFTGADDKKEGRLERANGGTLFLDEIGELSIPVQVKLLRVLQEGEIDRLGGVDPVQVDFRLVAATNADLEAAVKAGRFREDLYYRLNVIAIDLPPLRERPEDIELIADHFARRYALKNDKAIAGLSDAARGALRSYRWPGNVRELENVIERAVVLTRTDTIDESDLPAPLRDVASRTESIRREGKNVVIPVGTRLEDAERVLIKETLAETGGDKSLTAQLLGIAARTIYRRLEAERAADAAKGTEHE